MSIQYTVLGFEPTASHNHQTRDPALTLLIVNLWPILNALHQCDQMME